MGHIHTHTRLKCRRKGRDAWTSRSKRRDESEIITNKTSISEWSSNFCKLSPSWPVFKGHRPLLELSNWGNSRDWGKYRSTQSVTSTKGRTASSRCSATWVAPWKPACRKLHQISVRNWRRQHNNWWKTSRNTNNFSQNPFSRRKWTGYQKG